MDRALHDLRCAARSLAQRPAFVALAVFTLAVGLGASTTVFSVVDAVLLQPLPLPEPERLVRLWDQDRSHSRDRERQSPGNYLDWARRGELFQGVAAWHPGSVVLRSEHDAEAVTSVAVSPNYFQVLGGAAALGRTFAPDVVAGAVYDVAERYRSGDRVLVISDRLWRRRFGSDPGVVGRTISLDGAPWQVLGVMPAGFTMPSEQTDAWVPWDIATSYADLPGGPPRDWRFLNVVARLRPGVASERAQADADVVAASLAADHPKANDGWGVRLEPLKDDLVGASRPALLLLLGAVGSVLLLACANVAGLLLVRGAGRRREMIVRLALGASSGRLVRQVVAESLLVSAGALLAGLAAARAGVSVVRWLRPGELPRLDEVALDLRVLGFAAAAALVTGLLSAVAPALQAARAPLASALREEGGRTATAGSSRLRQALVGVELAVALVLLTGAGLLTRSFVQLTGLDPGFDPRNLLVLRVALDTAIYRTAPQSVAFFRELTQRLESMPGARAAGGVTALPLSEVGIEFDRPYWREGEADPGGSAPEVDIRMATTGYFEAMGMTLVRGRGFTDQDRLDTPRVIVVNDSLARRVWPGGDGVGQRLVIDYRGGAYPYEVVGVVNDTRHHGLRRDPRPEVFIPHAQNPYLSLNVVVRTSGEPRRLAHTAAGTVAALDPRQPVHSVVTMEELLARSVAPERVSMLLLAVLGAIALVLAATGVFGVLAYTVSSRTREIGTRVALGADRSDIARLVLGQSLRLAAAGTAAGLAVALALGRAVASMLYGVGPRDPWTLAGVCVLLGAVALLAAWVPARRAMRIDPAVALRCE